MTLDIYSFFTFKAVIVNNAAKETNIRHDIEIIDNSNSITGSVTNLGYGYHRAPENGEDSRFFLSGSYDKWLTTEIEVYQINK
jgi:hypothetical protein